MMSFGGQVVTFVTVTEDLTNRDRYGHPAKIRTEVAVPGCRFRPVYGIGLRADGVEKIDLGDVVKDPWKATAPPVAAVLNAKAKDEVKVGGVTYQIVGEVRTFPDMQGRPWKVTIICERMES